MTHSKSAFTLIEIMIVLGLILITLGSFYFISVYSFRQFVLVHQETEMKTDVANIRAMIESDMSRGGIFSINPDNHGINIKVSGIERIYLFKDEAIYLKNGDKETKLTKYPVCDGLWIMDNNIISMNIEYRYKNINTGSVKYFKVIRDFYI